MHPRLAELKRFIDDERKELLASASALSPARWNERAAPEKWSVGDVLWHLQKVEGNLSKLVQRKVAEARAAGHPPETDDSSVLERLDATTTTNRKAPIVAPLPTAPIEPVEPEAVLQQLEESRVLMHNALDAADGLALSSISHPHPAFGDLDLYQWILFVGLHERRHRAQIDETVSALASPATRTKGETDSAD